MLGLRGRVCHVQGLGVDFRVYGSGCGAPHPVTACKGFILPRATYMYIQTYVYVKLPSRPSSSTQGMLLQRETEQVIPFVRSKALAILAHIRGMNNTALFSKLGLPYIAGDTCECRGPL